MTSTEVSEHIGEFGNLIVGILKRRSLFRVFEKNLKGKTTADKVAANLFASLYILDYTRNQFIDLRKFFENDKKSFKISDIVTYVSDPKLKTEHDALYAEWKARFEAPTNMHIAHIDKAKAKIVSTVKKKDVDTFIDRVNNFYSSVIAGIKTKGTLIIDDSPRDTNGDYLNAASERDFDETIGWINKKLPIS